MRASDGPDSYPDPLVVVADLARKAGALTCGLPDVCEARSDPRLPMQIREARKSNRGSRGADNAPPAGYFRGRAGSVPVTAQHATPGGGSHGSQRGFRASVRPVPARAARALLPHAGLGPRCRGTLFHDPRLFPTFALPPAVPASAPPLPGP